MNNIAGTQVPFKSELYNATVEAERALLGAILTISETRKPISEVAAIISRVDFLEQENKDIFEAMLSTNSPPNQVTVAQEVLRITNGKHAYIAEMCLMVANCPCPLDYLHYAKTVRDYADARNGFKKVMFRGCV